MRLPARPDEPLIGSPLLVDGAFAWLDSPVGEVSVLAGPRGVRAIWLGYRPDQAESRQSPSAARRWAELSHAPSERALSHLSRAQEQLSAYFNGSLERFELALDLTGTPFQLRVWEALRSIPYGEAISYKRLAELAGSPGASRAVGGANGRNPVPIVVPCHRVIAANGDLGGFSSGLDRKRALLALEGVHPRQPALAAPRLAERSVD